MKPADKKCTPQAAANIDALLLSKRIDEQVVRSWRLFAKALLNATGNAIFVVNPSGTVVISNRRVQKSLGLFPGSLLATTWPDFWPYARKALEKRENFKRLPVQAGDASYLGRLAPIVHQGALIGLLCVLEDRTELEKTTRKMLSFQELSRELDAIIASSDDGLWSSDGNGTILRINAASERLNRIKAADVVGRNVDDLVDEGLIDTSVTRKVLQTRRRENILQQTRSGRRLMLTGNPVFNSKGELIRVVVNERDITEINALREELELQVAKNDQIQRHMQEMQVVDPDSGKMIARSANIVRAFGQARKVSQVDSTVLVTGETGTGKGVIANLIHRFSARADRPLIHVNCGAIPETLVESELFGYEKGAFTGAASRGKPGYFELADTGILFLDEVAELPIASQVKLLRFLEDGKVTRVGGTVAKTLDVRVICATHRDLESMTAQGEFRLDLYYRLNVVPIAVPPLRERESCKLPLVRHFISYFSTKFKDAIPLRISRRAMDALLAYHYPGNVRELMNICERLVVMAEAHRIGVDDLPAAITGPLSPQNGCRTEMLEAGETLPRTMAAIERQLILQALEKYGTQAKAAQALGINQSTIARKLKRSIQAGTGAIDMHRCIF
ncbi:sigma 54-interacting transcriptional regulator [uncultured Desulfosarcina sp.]|uniref:sigma 54-interacting transcriptional regulator n=1 Tax=uncultured Desulfosarcina sp. TaxID=218289 RepID=UPI0029C91831|nr:sigma 54-interacting transcriptional regulator [uncultured Desulfosarcina sp.]